MDEKRCPWLTIKTTTTENVDGKEIKVEKTEFQLCLAEGCKVYNYGDCGRVKKEVKHIDY